MATPAASSSAEAKDDSEAGNKKSDAAAAAASSRENFLRRLEQQQQQQQQQNEEPEAEKGEEEAVSSGEDAMAKKEPALVEEKQLEKDDGGGKASVVVGAGRRPKKRKDATPPENREKNPSCCPCSDAPQKKEPPENQILLDYLAKFCEAGGSDNAPSPSDWIQDVDASSLTFLKGLAGIKEENVVAPLPPTPPPPAPPVASYNTMQTSSLKSQASSSSSSDAMTAKGRTTTKSETTQDSTSTPPSSSKIMYGGEEETKMWEVPVPADAVPGQAFHISAGGQKVRVVCPKSAKVGQMIRFHLPVSLFETPPQPLYKWVPRDYDMDEDIVNSGVGGGLKSPPEQQKSNTAASSSKSASSVRAGATGKPKEDDTSSAKSPIRSASSSSASSTTKNNNNTAPKRTATTTTTTNSSTTSEKSKTTNTSSKDTDLQHRMLGIIEKQQSQMQEMQNKLDALGLIMANMQQDVSYLRGHSQQGQGRGGGDAPGQGYRIMGGLFNRGVAQPPLPPGMMRQPNGAAWQPPGFGRGLEQARAPPLPPNVPQMQQPVQPSPPVPPPRDTSEAGLPEAVQIPEPRRAIAHPVPDPEAVEAPAPAHHQGIFFPLFVMLFRFLLSLPHRLRSVLNHTGPGRIYAHLRRQAIARRAFANIDLGSIIKLLVMLLIFTGRVGGGGGEGNENRRNRGFNSGNINRVNEAENGMLAYAYSLVQAVYDYWSSHRVHTLILASVIGFLIQVGLMSFFYQVIWVEREDLLRAWLGQDAHVEEDEDLLDGDDNDNGGAPRLPGAPRAGANGPANANLHGGMIRRGPENGGILHDIQCLILSFLLSLIPAWRPEEAAQDLPEAPQVEPQQGEGGEGQRTEGGDGVEQPAAPDQEGGDGAGDENAAE